MKNRLYIGLAIAALILTNGTSYWLGKKSQIVTFEMSSIDFPSPNQGQLRAACAHMYIVDMEKDENTLVRVSDAQGVWDEINETILCSVASDTLIKRNGHIVNQPKNHSYFSIEKESATVTRHLSESEFKRRIENQF